MGENTTAKASDFVDQVDATFVFIFGVALFFLVVITIVMVYFIIRYRKSKSPEAKHIEGSTSLEIIWTVIPTIIVILMFQYGWSGWQPQREPPADAFQIKSIARMWSFVFQYENGRMTDTLYVPMGEPVKIDLVAQDVIHSMYIPAFRIKKDMVPGKKGNIWFEAGKEGVYDVFCAEYCGLRHSYMKTSVVVLPKDKFESWYVDTSLVVPPTAEAAKRLAGVAVTRKYGCNACHTTDGSKLVGPSYKGLWGRTHLVISGGEEREVTVDSTYIRRSIYDPNADVVIGYTTGLMLSYKDQVTEEELGQLIEYFKSLNN